MSLEDKAKKLIIDEAQIQNYFAQRDDTEHLKIKSPDNYYDEVVKYFSGELHEGATLPFEKMVDNWRLRAGDLTIVSGWSGHGKSMLLSYMMLHLLRNDYKCLIASFEMSVKSTLGRLIRQSSNGDKPSEDVIHKFLNNTSGKLFLYDQQGTTSPDSIMSVIYYSAQQLGVNFIVIDSLMKIGINEDDYNLQKQFTDRCAVACRDLGIHIFLVAHSRKGDEFGGAPKKHDVSGSTHLTNLADNVISVYRNKSKSDKLEAGKLSVEEAKIIPDAYMSVLKQRHFEYEGSVGLYYDPKSLRYYDRPIGR